MHSLPSDSTLARYGAGAFIYNKRLYIVGGVTERGPTGTVEVIAYNPATDTWALLDAKLPVPATGLRATTIIRGDTPLILVVGG